MGDIFDEVAGVEDVPLDVPISLPADSGGDIFDQIANSTQPSFLENVWSDVKETPSSIWSGIKSIPNGIDNVFSSVFSPKESIDNGTTEETLRGVGSLASGVAGAGAGAIAGTALAPVTFGASIPVGAAIGGAAGLLGFNKLNQLTGSDAPTAPEEDLAYLRKNTVQGLATTGVLKAGSKALSSIAKSAKPSPPEIAQVESLGINASDVKRAAKFKPVINDVPPIERAIQGGIERGVFTGDNTPIAMEARNLAAADAIAEELHGPTGILKAADAAQKDVAIPEFTRAQKFIADHPFDAEALTEQMNKRLSVANKIWDGTVSGLSKVKSALGNKAYTTLTDSKGLDQAITSDLRAAVESQVDALSPGMGAKVKDLNSKLSEHYTLEPLIERAKNKAIAVDYKAPPKAGLGQVLKSIAKGAVQGGVSGAIGSSVGLPGVTIPAAIALGTIKGGATALKNPTIANTVSGVASGFSKGAELAAPLSSGILSGAINKPKEEPSPYSSLFTKSKAMPTKPELIPAIEKEIDADPYLSALYQAESGRNPNAKNPTSSAKGGFQFIDSTAKNLGVKDPLDLKESLDAVKKMTDEHVKRFGNDPALKYAAHYLGATVLAKALKGETLSEKEKNQVEYLEKKALPDFMKIYEAKLA